MKPLRWLVVAAGATLIITCPTSVSAADPLSGLTVKAERPAGFRTAMFGEKKANVKSPPIVPLREAWESGAYAWSATRRNKFMNDAAVRASTKGLNSAADMQRGDGDPSDWLPAGDSRCNYVARWIAVKAAWGLSVDPAEAYRLRVVVAQCAIAAPTESTATPSTSSLLSTTTTVKPVTSSTTTVAGSSPNGATTLLSSIRIGPEYTAGYDRELFPHWKDLDGDGCDARENVLIRDSLVKATVGSGCKVIAGKWVSPYDGATWTNPTDIDIDHVVALNEAWQSGAYAWTTQQRTLYANDLTDSRTLMAVTDSVNQAKSDKDPSEWLPPLASYRCTYLSNWVAVKVRWSLRMDQVEYDAVKAGLAGCATTSSVVTAPNAAVPPVATSQTTTQSTTQATAAQVTSYVTPGAFCSPYGATGQSSSGVSYTCKPSDTEARNRWRR